MSREGPADRLRAVSTTSRLIASLLLALAGIACSGDDTEAPSCTEYEATTSVELLDFDYGPRCIEASPGDTLELTNEGDAPHTFTIDDPDLSIDLPAGDEGTLVLDGVTAGTTYAVRCIYHSQMTASLRIA